MVDRGRGNSPGAKGTAFPRASRPQKAGPPVARKGLPGRLGLPAKPLAQSMAGSKPPAAGKGPAPAGASKAPGGQKHNLQKNRTRAAPRASESAQERATNRPPAAALPSAGDGPTPDASAPVGVRVSKLLAERGLCSRREADEYIARGLVFVNGERVTELGVRADPGATITLATEAKAQQEERVTILLHKPVGYVSGLPEDGHQPAVVLVRPDTHHKGRGEAPFKPSHLKGLAPAGRLDIDSTGMLVLTQDGRIARQLIGEDSAVEKEYLVRVEGQLAPGGIEKLRHGLSLDGQALKRAEVEWLNEDQLRFVLTEGKKRQIRRMCELVGLKVVGLKRVRMGRVRLGDLPMGKWRYLKPGERF